MEYLFHKIIEMFYCRFFDHTWVNYGQGQDPRYDIYICKHCRKINRVLRKDAWRYGKPNIF